MTAPNNPPRYEVDLEKQLSSLTTDSEEERNNTFMGKVVAHTAQTALPAFSLILASAVVALAIFSGSAARDETSNAIIALASSSARNHVVRFFDPIMSIATSMRWTINTGALTMLRDSYIDYGEHVGPLFARIPGLLALYMARSSDGLVTKFSAEVPGQYIVEQRYVETQTKRSCTISPRSAPISGCVFGAHVSKNYDVKQKSWYTLGINMTAPSVLVGPERQTALAQGDIDRPVFNMVFNADQVATGGQRVVFKAKFLTSEMSSGLNELAIGKSGLAYLLNKADGRIVALNGNAGTVADILLPDGSGFHTIQSFNNGVKSFSLAQIAAVQPGDPPLRLLKGDRSDVLMDVPGIDSFVLVLSLRMSDFLPRFNERIILTLILAITSLSLMILRFLLMAFLRWYHGDNKVFQAASHALAPRAHTHSLAKLDRSYEMSMSKYDQKNSLKASKTYEVQPITEKDGLGDSLATTDVDSLGFSQPDGGASLPGAPAQQTDVQS